MLYPQGPLNVKKCLRHHISCGGAWGGLMVSLCLVELHVSRATMDPQSQENSQKIGHWPTTGARTDGAAEVWVCDHTVIHWVNLKAIYIYSYLQILTVVTKSGRWSRKLTVMICFCAGSWGSVRWWECWMLDLLRHWTHWCWADDPTMWLPGWRGGCTPQLPPEVAHGSMLFFLVYTIFLYLFRC